MAVFSVAGCAALATTDYPRLQGFQHRYSEDHFSVKVGGSKVAVLDYAPFGNDLGPERNYHYCHFAMGDGPAVIEIDAKEPIRTASVSPLAYGVAFTTESNLLRFKIDQPRYLVVQVNGKSSLYLLAEPEESDRPPISGVDSRSKRKVFNVTAAPYSADSTGRSLSTIALQKAIDDASRGPGGIVHVPPGTYITGAVSLRSRVWLYLAPGAVIAPDPDRTKWRKDSKPDQIINCKYTVGNRIYGRGVIDCQGVALGLQKVEGYAQLRIKPLKLLHSRNIEIEGITFKESTAWTIAPEGGSQIRIRNVKILNGKKWGTDDGINICGGGDIVIERCFITCMDDAICMKGLWYGDVGKVQIKDVVVDTTRSGLKIGMQGLSEVRDIEAKGLNVIRCAKGIDLVHYYGSKPFRNIRVTDSRIEKVQGGAAGSMAANSPIRVLVSERKDRMYPRGVGPIHDIEFSRITVDDPGPNTIRLQGHDDANAVSNVAFRDIMMEGKAVTATDGRIEPRQHTRNISVQGKVIVP